MPARTEADATSRQVVAAIRRRLLGQARLFDDPHAYAAGVADALEAVIEGEAEAETEPDAGRTG